MPESFKDFAAHIQFFLELSQSGCDLLRLNLLWCVPATYPGFMLLSDVLPWGVRGNGGGGGGG